MPKRQKIPRDHALKTYLLTINQVVSYNLSRARRSRGWTQEETAARLEAASGKRWTAATLSASERALVTDRARVFDANELITFSRVFEYPVTYFLLPVEPESRYEEEQIFYALTRRGESDGVQTERLLEMEDLLQASVPVKYPAAFTDAVNRLLAPKGVVWQPYSRVEWEDGEDEYDTWRSLNDGEQDEFTLDEWETLADFARLVRRHSLPRVLRLLADATEQTGKPAKGDYPEDPPF